MGYNSSYSLTWKPRNEGIVFKSCEHNKKDTDKFCPECGKENRTIQLHEKIGKYIASHVDMNYCLCPTGVSRQAAKWYSFKKDMIEMSLEFKDVLFSLIRSGEESGDIEMCYFLNGGIQIEKARIVFNSFDEDKLEYNYEEK